MPVSIESFLKDALLDLGVVRANETPNASLAAFMLGRFNQILNDWNADGRAVYTTDFLTFPMVPSLSPHTIGPDTATFDVDQRPVEIIGDMNVILADTTPSVRSPVVQHDSEWWFSLSVPSIETIYPTDFYYSPDWPNGSIYLWPVPTSDNDLEMQVRRVLADVEMTDTFSLPPGYQSALRKTLAEDAAEPLGRQISERYAMGATKARARIFDLNDQTPLLRTQDSGMPSGSNRQATYNYRTGLGR